MGTSAIGRTERNQQVTPETLEQREPAPSSQTATPSRPRDAAAVLAALRQRIADAKSLMPAPHDVHCRDCFQKGRDAVLRAIEGDE